MKVTKEQARRRRKVRIRKKLSGWPPARVLVV
jgi:ribosomal protein L18